MSNTKPNKNQRKGNRSDGDGTKKSGNSGSGTNGSGNNSNGGSNNGGSNNGGSNSGGLNNKASSNARQGEKGRANNSNNRRRKGPRKKKVDPRVFWGDPEQLAELGGERATITTNPSAVVQSLGRPPLSGQQNAAEHYFVAVYDRAVNLAAALAAAGGLIEAEELNPDNR